MEDYSHPLSGKKDQSSFLYDEEQNEIQKSQKLCYYTEQAKLLFYEQNVGRDLSILALTARNMILQGQNKIIWTADFAGNLTVTTINFDDQSMTVILHYANYKMTISAILTQLDDGIFSGQIYDNGSFGTIYEIQNYDQKIVLKGINYLAVEEKVSCDKIYKQYFMAKISSCLKTGPMLNTFLGYDLVFFKKKAFFAMQKCSPAFTDISKTQRDLVENLRLMHSIGFMHLDIKPDNTAFSEEFKKFVFIDFGFSRLVVEPLGKKTFTLFYGTLSYCSEQMKNVYYSGFPSYVDLYYNDIVSLIKTCQKKKKYFQITKKLLDHMRISEGIQVRKSSNSLLKNTLTLLRLKYYIWSSNEKKVLQLAKQAQHIPYTICEVLSSRLNLNQFQQNHKVVQLISQLKGNILKHKLILSEDDKYFTQLFKTKSTPSFTPTYLSIQHILSLPQQKFGQFTQNIQWIQKIFSVLNPLSNYYPRSSQQQFLKSIYKQRMRLIEKIYFYLVSKKRCRSSNIIYYRSWTVIDFIYQKLKPLKNRQLLVSIRLIFLLLCDYHKIEQLSNEIITLTDDQNLKLLTIAQHQLFLDIVLKYLEPVNQEYISIAKNQQKVESEQTRKIRSFTIEILKRQRKYYQIYCKQRILPLLRELQQINGYGQTIGNICLLYGYLARVNLIKQQKSPTCTSTWPALYESLNLVQMIYSAYFETFNSSKVERGEFYYLALVYKPLQLIVEGFSGEQKLRKNLEEICQIKKQTGKSWINVIGPECEKKLVEKPDFFLYLMKLCKLLHSSVRKTRINVFFMFQNIFYFIDIYYRFKSSAVKQNESNKSTQILAIIGSLYDDLKNRDEICWNQPWLQVYKTSFQGVFFLLQNEQATNLKKQKMKAEEVYAVINSIKYLDNKVIYCFLSFFVEFQWCIRNQRDEHFIQRYIIDINDLFSAQSHIIISKINTKFLELVILINSKRHLYEKNIGIVTQHLFKISRNSHSYYQMFRWQIISQSIQTLCLYTPQTLLKEFFLRTIGKPQDAILVEEVYVEFHLFRHLSSELEDKQKSSEIFRLFGYLNTIERSQTKKLRSGIYQIWRVFKKNVSNRKVVCCLKRQENYKFLTKKLEQKLYRFHKKMKMKLKRKLSKMEK